jgi:hypothetical protein
LQLLTGRLWKGACLLFLPVAREASYRCKPCHNLRSKLDRLINGKGRAMQKERLAAPSWPLVLLASTLAPPPRQDWQELSQDEKKAFLASQHEVTGADLEQALKQHLTMVKIRKTTVTFEQVGDFKDVASHHAWGYAVASRGWGRGQSKGWGCGRGQSTGWPLL